MSTSSAPSRPPGRPLDPEVTQAILEAALGLLVEQGFPRMTMESIAAAAGVGKPAVYRRFKDKSAVVVAALRTGLRPIEAPDFGDTRAEIWDAANQGLPPDPRAYVGFIAGVIAEHERHPELVEAFRRTIVLPRRAAMRELIERGKQRGDIRADVDPEMAMDMFMGQILARSFAGLDIGEQWRRRTFDAWWEILRT